MVALRLRASKRHEDSLRERKLKEKGREKGKGGKERDKGEEAIKTNFMNIRGRKGRKRRGIREQKRGKRGKQQREVGKEARRNGARGGEHREGTQRRKSYKKSREIGGKSGERKKEIVNSIWFLRDWENTGVWCWLFPYRQEPFHWSEGVAGSFVCDP